MAVHSSGRLVAGLGIAVTRRRNARGLRAEAGQQCRLHGGRHSRWARWWRLQAMRLLGDSAALAKPRNRV
jgi:hypothetical protein